MCIDHIQLLLHSKDKAIRIAKQVWLAFILTAAETNILLMVTEDKWAEGAWQEIRAAAGTPHIAQPDLSTACSVTVWRKKNGLFVLAFVEKDTQVWINQHDTSKF